MNAKQHHPHEQDQDGEQHHHDDAQAHGHMHEEAEASRQADIRDDIFDMVDPQGWVHEHANPQGLR